MEVIVLNLLNLATLGLILVHRYRKRARSFLEPGILFAVVLALLYPVRIFVLQTFGSSGLPLYPGVDDPVNLADVSLLSLLGSIGYVVGYLAVLRRQRLGIIAGNGEQRYLAATTICLVFFAVALLGMAYKIATNDYISYLIGEQRNSALTQISNVFTSMQWPAFIGVWILLFSGNRSPRFLLVFGAVNIVIIPYQFIQGSKTFLSLLLLSVVVSYYWQRGKFPKFAILASVILVALFVFPYVHSFREAVNLQYGGIPSLTELDFRSFRNIESQSDGEGSLPLNRFARLSQRFGGADELYNLTQIVPDLLPYRLGEAYLAVPVNLVPRAIWPDKPVFSRGAQYGSVLGTTTSVTPFPYGEAFWDGGVLGVALFMGLWGSFLALLVKGYEGLYKRLRYRFFIVAFLLAQLHWIAGGESSMPMVLSGLPQQAAVLVALYWVIRELGRRETRVAARLQRYPRDGMTTKHTIGR